MADLDDNLMEDQKILIVGPDLDQAVLDVNLYVELGVVNPTAHEEPLEDFMARGRPPDCNCGHITCICALVAAHSLQCRYRKSVSCPVAIECEHGFDVCPTCDACDCEAP